MRCVLVSAVLACVAFLSPAIDKKNDSTPGPLPSAVIASPGAGYWKDAGTIEVVISYKDLSPGDWVGVSVSAADAGGTTWSELDFADAQVPPGTTSGTVSLWVDVSAGFAGVFASSSSNGTAITHRILYSTNAPPPP